VHTTFEVRDTLLHIPLVQVNRPEPAARDAEAVEVLERLSDPDRLLSAGDSLGKLATFAERVP